MKTTKNSPDQQLVDMANEEKDPFLKELLLEMVVTKIVSDIFEEKKL